MIGGGELGGEDEVEGEGLGEGEEGDGFENSRVKVRKRDIIYNNSNR